MAQKDDKILEVLVDIKSQIDTVDKNVALQGQEIKHMSGHVEEIKDEQKRQNAIVSEHERRSTASEGRLDILEGEHNTFRERITVAEQPSLILNNIWKALLALGAGAGSMYAILRLLEQVK